MGVDVGRKRSPGAASNCTSRLANFIGGLLRIFAAVGGRKCLFEIGDDVGGRFQSDGAPDQSLGNSEMLAHFGAKIGVRGGGRMGDEGLQPAETFGAGTKLR